MAAGRRAAHYISGGLLVNIDALARSPVFGPRARSPAPECTAPTASPRTLFSRAWCSGRASRRDPFRARPTRVHGCPRRSRRRLGRPAGHEAAMPIPVRLLADCGCGAEGDLSRSRIGGSSGDDVKAGEQRRALQAAMTTWAGVVRDASSLARATEVVADAARGLASTVDRATAEVRNLTDVAKALLEAATARAETRGSQARRGLPGDLTRVPLPPGARRPSRAEMSRDRRGGACRLPTMTGDQRRDDLHPPIAAVPTPSPGRSPRTFSPSATCRRRFFPRKRGAGRHSWLARRASWPNRCVRQRPASRSILASWWTGSSPKVHRSPRVA